MGFISITMKKEDISILAQLLSGMKDALAGLEEADRAKDVEKISEAKKEIRNFQNQIDKLL